MTILHAAALMFADQGLANTTTEQLIQAAGCSTGTFYRCIGRKENLPAAVYDYVHAHLAGVESQWPLGFRGTASDTYNALLGRWLAVTARGRQVSRYFLYWQQYRSSPAGWARVREAGWVLGPFHEEVAPILRQLLQPVANPVVPQPVGAELAAALWMGHWTAVLGYSPTLAVTPPRTAEHVLVEAFNAWWCGLQIGPVPAPRSQ